MVHASPLLVQAGANVWFIPHHYWCKLVAMCGSYLTTIGASWWQCVVHASPLLVQAGSNVVHTSPLLVQAGGNVWFMPHHSWCKLVAMCGSYLTTIGASWWQCVVHTSPLLVQAGGNVWFMPHHSWCKLAALIKSLPCDLSDHTIIYLPVMGWGWGVEIVMSESCCNDIMFVGLRPPGSARCVIRITCLVREISICYNGSFVIPTAREGNVFRRLCHSVHRRSPSSLPP